MAATSPSKLAIRATDTLDLHERLGTGATSEVWRARTSDGSALVLKIGKDPAQATSLANEALVSTFALSPRLPELVCLGTVERSGDHVAFSETGLPCIGFRDPGSRSLDQRTTRLDVDDVLRIAHDVAEGLADLHQVGLAHGDVKPQNVTFSHGQGGLIDLGLAGPALQTEVTGATPRYLATGDPRLGDARARDLLAFGLLIAELASDEVAASTEPLALARRTTLDARLAPICAALLSPEPGARPSARWVRQRARASLDVERESSSQTDARVVRAAYMRLTRVALGRAKAVSDDTAPWAAISLAHHVDARAMCRAGGCAPPHPLRGEADLVLQPLVPAERWRWLVALVGIAATSWPADIVSAPTEPELARALEGLANELRPEVWTLRDVERALGQRQPRNVQPLAANVADPAACADLAIRLCRIPPDWHAIEAVETHTHDAPAPLVLAAADALRLSGQLGRARSLLAGAQLPNTAGMHVVADILRRCGEHQQARDIAEQALATGGGNEHRARACLARVHYECGELDQARAIVGDSPNHACTCEVAALVKAARGDLADAIALARRGYALAQSTEDRARLSATIAYIEHGTHADEARRRFRAAAEHAVQAGAVLEEASYRIGEAAASVDVGEIEAAVAAAQRAAVLWEEVLMRPEMSARAWLARAAAFATIDGRHEATYAAEQAIARAAECGDDRAQAYAWWVIADVAEAGSDVGASAAATAQALLTDDQGDDVILAASRRLVHVASAIDETTLTRFDTRCRHATKKPASTLARLSWWGARATSILADGITDRDDAGMVVAELCAVVETDAPVEAAGRAAYAGTLVAAALSDTDALTRLEVARSRRAESVRRGAGRGFVEMTRACQWVTGRQASPSLDPSHAMDLRQLVLALSERDSLRDLLVRVLDVLIMWTGAERGLLLMKTPEATLVPRAARNLGRSDLEREQLAVSTSLAERALATGEAVVAIDAMEELSSSFDSVHALKLRSVLALPLIAHGEVLGVVYLDDRLRKGAFGQKELAWAKSVAPVAALAIADARTQVQLRRAARSAERASRRLEDALAAKETALDVAERELARTHHGDAARLRYPDIIGDSEPMTKLLQLTDRVARSDVPVLLFGESGSGKELVARALHRGSERRDNAFVGENCGALPETLLESTLFGHTKGAFTGAHRPRVGLFEAADGGTLFLDEIGEMSLGMQTKLLRILEDSMVRPVGSTRSKKVDVRIVAATHRDLEAMVASGAFREDLYYRLNVIAIRIPPLRDRTSDIPLLVAHLMEKHAPGRNVHITRSAYARLQSFDWPGNVRQLENEVRRALLLAEGTIDAQHLSIGEGDASTNDGLGLNVRARIDHMEVELVGEAMGRTGGNQTQAAKLLGVSRYGLHKMMKRLGIAPIKKKRGS